MMIIIRYPLHFLDKSDSSSLLSLSQVCRVGGRGGHKLFYYPAQEIRQCWEKEGGGGG